MYTILKPKSDLVIQEQLQIKYKDFVEFCDFKPNEIVKIKLDIYNYKYYNKKDWEHDFMLQYKIMLTDWTDILKTAYTVTVIMEGSIEHVLEWLITYYNFGPFIYVKNKFDNLLYKKKLFRYIIN